MNKRVPVTLLLLLFTMIRPATALISGGGNFSLEMSAIGSGNLLGQGVQSLSSAIGDSMQAVIKPEQPLKAPGLRLFKGMLGVPPKADPSLTNFITIGDGDVRIVIPANTLSQPYEPMVELDPSVNPIVGTPHAISLATQKLVSELGPDVNQALAFVELRILLEDNSLLSDFPPPNGTFFIEYADRGDGGQIWVVRFDEQQMTWDKMQNVITNGQTATFSNGLIGIYAVFQQGQTEVNGAYAFPVPWRPNANDPARYGTKQTGITFTRLPSVGDIQIYNLMGELVRELKLTPGAEEYNWDGRTASGNDVASGVYVWAVEVEGKRKLGKLMIIR